MTAASKTIALERRWSIRTSLQSMGERAYCGKGQFAHGSWCAAAAANPRATRAVIATIISPGIDLLFGGDLMLHRRKVSAPADHDR
jgi:hypothetical protein